MSGNTGVTWGQRWSFSPLLARTRAAEAVFWPGCAAMKLGSELVLRAYAALRETMPDLGFSSWCCAKPTLAVGADAQKAKRTEQLQRYFAENGIETVYTLCPNCQRTLSRAFEVRVLPAWPLLADRAERHPGPTTAFSDAAYRLHDPCAGRKDVISQDAARRLLSARQVTYTEFAHCGPSTRCCGRLDMLFLTDPPAARRMLDARVAEADGAPILTYCESCVEAFRGAGQQSFHLLEVLFDAKDPRAFGNRITNAEKGIRYA